MKRYIDTDLIPYSDDDDYLSQYAYRHDIDEIPTADVVSKSESLPLDVHEALKQRAVEKAKAEIAREIFKEIQNSLDETIHFYNMLTVNTFDSIEQAKARASKDALVAIRDYIKERKKKYTEGPTDGKE